MNSSIRNYKIRKIQRRLDRLFRKDEDRLPKDQVEFISVGPQGNKHVVPVKKESGEGVGPVKGKNFSRAESKPISELQGEERAKETALTPEQKKRDEEYMKAVESGDIETAQIMVDEAAKKAFSGSKIVKKNGTPKQLYHGTTAKFNTFKRGDIGAHFGTKKTAQTRVGRGKNANLIPVYLNITNPIVCDTDYGDWHVGDRMIKDFVEKGILSKKEAINVLYFKEDYEDRYRRRSDGNETAILRSTLIDKGYDGMIYPNFYEGGSDMAKSYIIFEPQQAKLSDPVTYDDDGKPIPLSDRFNPNSKDIRY